MNNSVYGKTVENLWKRIHFRFVNNASNYIRYTSKSSYVSHKILNKSVVTMHKTKPGLTIDKPIDLGLSILDLSKLLIYEFHQKYIKRKFNANLLFANTESLIYEVETDDVYEDFYADKDLFDFSDYSKSFWFCQ